MFDKDVPLSDCCGAPPSPNGIHFGDGLCSECKEHSEFYDANEILVLEW